MRTSKQCGDASQTETVTTNRMTRPHQNNKRMMEMNDQQMEQEMTMENQIRVERWHCLASPRVLAFRYRQSANPVVTPLITGTAAETD
jgi:hypothetical protein